MRLDYSWLIKPNKKLNPYKAHLKWIFIGPKVQKLILKITRWTIKFLYIKRNQINFKYGWKKNKYKFKKRKWEYKDCNRKMLV